MHRPTAVDLGERLKRAIDDSELDRGVGHMDLTLANVLCPRTTISRRGSRAIPLLDTADLAGVVDAWLDWVSRDTS